MPFLSEPGLIPGKTKEDWNKSILTGKLTYASKKFDRNIKVPAGFKTDYASIPRAFQLFIPKVARHRYAAVVHDWLYNRESPYVNMTRKEADDIFLEAMADLQVSPWMRWTMYSAVRAFGWALFKGGMSSSRKYKHKRR